MTNEYFTVSARYGVITMVLCVKYSVDFSFHFLEIVRLLSDLMLTDFVSLSTSLIIVLVILFGVL